MGGRKGYSLKAVVGDLGRIRKEKKELLQGVRASDVKMVVGACAKILAKSEDSLDSLVHGYIFAGRIKKDDEEMLGRLPTKERKAALSERWASYREKAGKQFDAHLNREIVDTATRNLGKKE